MDILYSRDSTERIVSWEILVINLNTFSEIRILEGLLDGKKTQTSRKVTKTTNQGKMNERLPYEQACKEAESRWIKKKKQGYKSLEDLGIEIINN